MSDYQLQKAKEEGRQEVWRTVVFFMWAIIIVLCSLLFGDALIEYGRSTSNVTPQTSSPIYRIEVDAEPQFSVQPTAVPTVPSLQQGTTVNKPGKP